MLRQLRRWDEGRNVRFNAENVDYHILFSPFPIIFAHSVKR